MIFLLPKSCDSGYRKFDSSLRVTLMRTNLLFLTLLVLAVAASPSSAQDHSSVVKAFEAGCETRADFDTVFEFVSPRENETRWRQVPWIPSLWEGMKAAEEKKKPMFIWAMNGDPLGCV